MDNVEICMARKAILQDVYSKETGAMMQVEITKHDPAGANAALTILARDILFMVASAEHAVKEQKAKLLAGTVSSVRKTLRVISGG